MMAQAFERQRERRKLAANQGTGMHRPSLSLALLALLGACATAPEPKIEAPTETTGSAGGYGAPIEERAMALAAAEPSGAMPSGLQISLLTVEETANGLFYSAELSVPARRREDRNYVIYGQCASTDLDGCARQIVSGARLLAKD